MVPRFIAAKGNSGSYSKPLPFFPFIQWKPSTVTLPDLQGSQKLGTYKECHVYETVDEALCHQDLKFLHPTSFHKWSFLLTSALIRVTENGDFQKRFLGSHGRENSTALRAFDGHFFLGRALVKNRTSLILKDTCEITILQLASYYRDFVLVSPSSSL